VKEKIELPRAKSLCFERFTELDCQLDYISGDRLRRADRLGEDTAHLDKVRRANRVNRLAEASHGLIEAPAKFRTKAQDERCSWCFCRFADAFEAEDAKLLHPIFGQAKGGDGQIENGLRAFPRRTTRMARAP
jgi:hypothetical protein